MTHGDDHGIIIPPRIAPVQIDILELFSKKDSLVSKISNDIYNVLTKEFRVNIDKSDKNPGFKAANSEIHGTPLRIEIGPNDVKNNQVIFVRRDTLEKITIKIENVFFEAQKILEEIQNNLYNNALTRLNNNFSIASNYNEFKKLISEGK